VDEAPAFNRIKTDRYRTDLPIIQTMTNIDKILESFKAPRSSKEKKAIPKTIWRVKVNGQFVQTISGKTVWKRIGDAKNAIIKHLEAWHYMQPNSWALYGRGQITGIGKKILGELIAKQLIEFVELPL